MMRVNLRTMEMAGVVLWGVACWLFFQFSYSYHFFFQEQNQLYLLSAEYLGTYFRKPGCVACIAGDFLTQFYYYRYAGAPILTLSLLMTGDLLRRAFGQMHKGRWGFWAAFALMTVEACFCLHHAHRLSSVLSILGGVILFLVYSLVSSRVRTAFQVLFGVFLGILSYVAFGCGWIAYTLLVIAYDMMKKAKAKAWGLVFAILLLITANVHTNRLYLLDTYSNLTYPGIGKPAWPEWELEKTLAIDNEYHFGNWQLVEQLVEQEQHPNEVQLFFYNLVKAQKGELPDHLLRFNPNQLGTFYTIGPTTPKLIINNMNELYWTLGDMTLTERAAMMTNVFAPDNRNVRMMKRLAECNLVSGDTLAANKYLRLLQKTWVYAEWARQMSQGEPKAFGYILEKRKYANQADTIRLSDNLHMVMMELLDSNPGNTMALDYILCSTLLLKDMDNFKRDYDRYCLTSGNPRVKPLYQQALMIWLAGTNAPEEEWKRYIIDQEQLQRFREYNQHRGDTRFSDTYWYYFDTAKAPKI